MKRSVSAILLCLCIYWHSSVGVNILVVLPNVDYDEFKETSKLAQQLSIKQHNVTIVSPFALEDNGEINQVLLTGDVESVKNEKNKIYDTGYNKDSYWSKLKTHEAIGLAYLEFVVGSDSFKELVASNNTTFDLVILEDVGAYGLAVLSEIFNCPLITLLSEPLSLFYENFVFDNNMWKLEYYNYIYTAHYWVFKEFYMEFAILPNQRALLKDIIPNELNCIKGLYTTRLVLMPSYQSISNLLPKYYHVKQIGGYNRLSWDEKLKNVKTTYRNNTENVVVISKRLPEMVKIELEKMNFSIPVKIVNTWNVSKMIGNPNVQLFIGDGNVYETDIVASMKIPIVRIQENRWDQQFLADSLTEEMVILSASVKDKNLLESVCSLSLLVSTVFGKYVRFSSSMMQSEREHESGMENAVYWIEHTLKYPQNSYFDDVRVRLDVENRWIIIAIVLVVIDIALFLLFYWIFKHLLRFIFFLLVTVIVLIGLLVHSVRKVSSRKAAGYINYDQIDKLGLWNNDQLEKLHYVKSDIVNTKN